MTEASCINSAALSEGCLGSAGACARTFRAGPCATAVTTKTPAYTNRRAPTMNLVTNMVFSFLSWALEDTVERTMDVHIKSLRKKLNRPGLIETVRGVGYRCVTPNPAATAALEDGRNWRAEDAVLTTKRGTPHVS